MRTETRDELAMALHRVVCPFHRGGPSHMDHGPDHFDMEHAGAMLAILGPRWGPPTSGHGRVTNRRLDQRLKTNRDRRAAVSTADPDAAR